jgi:hypothetical protein
VQHYEFYQESLQGLLGCEPSDVLPCARFQPIVLYQFTPPAEQIFQAGINTVQRFEFDVDGAVSNAAALFEDVNVPRRLVHIIPPEFSVVKAPLGNPIPFEPLKPALAIKNGNAGKVDNFHQTSRLQIDEPTFSLGTSGPGHPYCGGQFISVSPGCEECAHIHWRWGGAVECVDPTFFGANGAGQPIIRAGSNQDVYVAVSLFRPGEEHPDDYTKLLNGESLLGGLPVFWYSAFGHHATDTFFLHGGFFVSQP